jgi:hypothetical protein
MYYHKLVFVGAELANGGAKDVSTKIEAQISDVRSFSTPQLQLPAFHLDPDRFLLLRLDNITRSTHLMLSQHSTETLHSSQSLIPIRTRQRVSSFDNRHTPLGRLCQHTMKKATTRRKEMVGTGSLFQWRYRKLDSAKESLSFEPTAINLRMPGSYNESLSSSSTTSMPL